MGWRLSPMRIQREGAQLQIRGTWSAGPGDDQARFLADLRALRDSAAIGYDELAARAHYPSDVLKEAENGPLLPGLPILTAYVRACEGDVLDWEERWRRLNPEVADDPDLPVRPAGASPAAVAGARAGVGVGAPDVYDPERIRAALRGDHVRSGQDSRRANDQGISALACPRGELRAGPAHGLGPGGVSRDSGASWGASASWDTPADPGITSANGNHPAKHASRGPFDAAFTVPPDPAERTEPAQDQDFSWLDNSQPEAQPTEAADRGYAWLERADTSLAAQPEAAPGARRHRTDTAASGRRPDVTGTDGFLGQADARRTDRFLGQAAATGTDRFLGQADRLSPGPGRPAAARADATGRGAGHHASVLARVCRHPNDFGGRTRSAGRDRRRPRSGREAAAAQPLSSAGLAAQATGSQRDDRRKDRFFPVRLLAVIVIAALIGSALVLLLK